MLVKAPAENFSDILAATSLELHQNVSVKMITENECAACLRLCCDVDRFEYKQNNLQRLSCSSTTKFLKMESSYCTAEAFLGGQELSAGQHLVFHAKSSVLSCFLPST